MRCTLTLHKEIWQAFKNKAQTYKLSPTSVLLTLYGQVLARYSKNSHFLINLTLFNRLPLHPKIDQIMGDFTSLSLLEYGASTQEETKENFLTRVQALQNLLWHDLRP